MLPAYFVPHIYWFSKSLSSRHLSVFVISTVATDHLLLITIISLTRIQNDPNDIQNNAFVIHLQHNILNDEHKGEAPRQVFIYSQTTYI